MMPGSRCTVAILLYAQLLAAAANPLDVPFVPQVKAGCGSAALAMVIQYWASQQPGVVDAAIDSEHIDKWLPASAKGIQGKALKQYLEAHRFQAFVFNGEISDLQHHLEKGRPIVVCLAPRGVGKALHYAVVVGVEDETVWLNDSARGKLFPQERSRFLDDWKGTDHWSLLAVPRQAR